MIDELWDFLAYIAVPVVICVVGLLGLLSVAYAGVSWECGSYGDVTGRDTQVRALNCYVEYQEEWMLHSEYEKIIVAREGLADES